MKHVKLAFSYEISIHICYLKGTITQNSSSASDILLALLFQISSSSNPEVSVMVDFDEVCF